MCTNGLGQILKRSKSETYGMYGDPVHKHGIIQMKGHMELNFVKCCDSTHSYFVIFHKTAFCLYYWKY